jgi:hypothetical protein
MHSKKLVDTVGRLVDRRTFMGRAVAGVGAVVVGVFMKPQVAEAANCCGLCPSPTCTQLQLDICFCKWTWTCCTHLNAKWDCVECAHAIPPGCPGQPCEEGCSCYNCLPQYSLCAKAIGYGIVDGCRDDYPCS